MGREDESRAPPLPDLMSLSTKDAEPNGDSPQPSFPFFALPAELRCKVLDLLLKYDTDVRRIPSDGAKDRKGLSLVDLSLLAVSRKMKDEAETIFYTQNVMRVYITASQPTVEVPPCVKEASEMAGSVRHVHIHIRLLYQEDVPSVRSSLGDVSVALNKGRDLRSLLITISHHVLYMYDYNIDEFFDDRTTEAFSGLLGAGKVVCTELQQLRELNMVKVRSWVRQSSENY